MNRRRFLASCLGLLGLPVALAVVPREKTVSRTKVFTGEGDGTSWADPENWKDHDHDCPGVVTFTSCTYNSSADMQFTCPSAEAITEALITPSYSGYVTCTVGPGRDYPTFAVAEAAMAGRNA